ncbi:hypothetical protein CORC01_04857, partial [Colletotrichum orchidophilum]
FPPPPFPSVDLLRTPPRCTRDEKPGLPSLFLYTPPRPTGILIPVSQVCPGLWEVCVWVHLCKSSSFWMTYSSMLLCYDSSYMY